jgi:hypothetical protein
LDGKVVIGLVHITLGLKVEETEKMWMDEKLACISKWMNTEPKEKMQFSVHSWSFKKFPKSGSLGTLWWAFKRLIHNDIGLLLLIWTQNQSWIYMAASCFKDKGALTWIMWCAYCKTIQD